MKISQLKQPYKKLAQFYTHENKKKKRGLTLGNGDAFSWGHCLNFGYTESHWKFWSDVNEGKSPKIPKDILDDFNKHNPKQAFTVMGMPKPVSEKPKGVTAKKAKAKVSYEHLVGKKIKGFAFGAGTDDVFYNDIMMDKFIGKTGTIKRVELDCAMVRFPGSSITWAYPLSLVLKQLVEAGPKGSTGPDDSGLSGVNLDDLVGRKITSFTFEPGTNGIHYDPEMDNLLGYDGTIIAAYPDAVQVSFETRKGTILKFFPFGKDVKSSLTGKSAESYLIPEEEVQKILDDMPAEPFKVGETVYLRGNGGQYKCVIDRIYFSGNCPISLDAGRRTVLKNVRIDGRRSPKGDVILSRTPWRNEKGFMLEIHNAKLLTPQGEEIINMELNPFELSELELSKAADVLEAAGAIQVVEAVDLFASMLHNVHAHTSEITIADVDYHASLIKRKLSK